jgi:DNA-binding FrmR family transcriptional regulator
MKKQLHSSHPEIMKRLKRASGHLQTIIKMLEAERDCLEIAQQIHAVERAVNAAKKKLSYTITLTIVLKPQWVQSHVNNAHRWPSSRP